MVPLVSIIRKAFIISRGNSSRATALKITSLQLYYNADRIASAQSMEELDLSESNRKKYSAATKNTVSKRKEQTRKG